MSDKSSREPGTPTLVVEKSADHRRLEDLRTQLETEQERLQFLFESGKAISRIFKLDELLEFSAGLILSFADADTCAVYLRGKDRRLHAAKVKRAGGRGGKELKVSKTILQHVVGKRVAIITRSAAEDDRFMHGASIVMGGIQSVMCVPLMVGEKALGVLYVVSDRPTRQFDEGSLDVLNAFASQLAVAIENARLFELEERLRVREREAALGRMAGEISHAIKNRLNSMMGPAELIEMVVDEKEEVLNCAGDIKEGVKALRDYVVNNLDYLRTGGGKREEEGGAPIGEVVDYCVDVCKERFSKEGIKVARRRSDKLPRVGIEREKMEIILDNLLNNSADAMRDSATRQIMIGVFWEPGEGEVAVQFTDTGCGVAKEDHARVFEDYFTTKAEGTGIGLAQSRAMLERCGGSIDIRSEKGKGATFLITLPVVKESR